MDARLYASLNDPRKTHLEGEKPEVKNLTKAEGTTATKVDTAIKCKTTGNIKVNEK